MFVDAQEEKTCGRSHSMRTQDARGIIPKNQVITPSWVLKSKRLINDQVLGKILYISMSMRTRRLALDKDWIWECKIWPIEGFFSFGSANKIGGFAASNLDALGVGWEEQLLHFCFPNVSYFMFLNVVEYV